jgi:hypothetical protein
MGSWLHEQCAVLPPVSSQQLQNGLTRSVGGGAAGGSDQSGFVIGNDFYWDGFEQGLHAAFADEGVHE